MLRNFSCRVCADSEIRKVYNTFLTQRQKLCFHEIHTRLLLLWFVFHHMFKRLPRCNFVHRVLGTVELLCHGRSLCCVRVLTKHLRTLFISCAQSGSVTVSGQKGEHQLIYNEHHHAPLLYQTKFWRTKVPKIRHVAKKIFRLKICPPKYFVCLKFCPSKLCPIRY